MNRYEALSKALRTNAGKSVRSEDLEDYEDFYVDPFHSAILEGNANQLIYGRRGSGKTLMLGAVNERIQEEFPQNRVMSFYYTATKFRSSAEFGGMKPTVKEQTHAFFHTFIQQLCQDISELVDRIIAKPRWLSTLTLAGEAQAQRRDRLITAVLELLEAASYGTDNPLPSSAVHTNEKQVTRGTSSDRSIGLGATIGGNAQPAVELKAGLGFARTRAESHHDVLALRSGRKFSPSRVRELIVDIVEMLDLDYLEIFIDEWMSLSECQVEFAERLRLCLFGEKRIAVKIAADQFQGQFNNAGEGHHFRGLEIGGDIFVAVDLDRPFRNPEKSLELFAEALYRRLVYFEPELENHFGRAPLVNRDRFIDTLFATRQAYVELCRAAQGLCRDFHLIFKICAKQVERNLSHYNRIDLDCVRQAIIEESDNTYALAENSVDSKKLLYKVIYPHITASRSRYFILESQCQGYTAVLNDLISKRIIHSIPASSLHPSIRGEYNCFEIDYGMFLNFTLDGDGGTAHANPGGYNPAEVVSINAANRANYVLDMSVLSNNGRLLMCPECDSEFSSEDRAYAKRGICPHCFEDQPAEQVRQLA